MPEQFHLPFSDARQAPSFRNRSLPEKQREVGRILQSGAKLLQKPTHHLIYPRLVRLVWEAKNQNLDIPEATLNRQIRSWEKQETQSAEQTELL